MLLYTKLRDSVESAKPIDNILETPAQAHRIDLKLRDFSPLGAATRSHKVPIYLVTRSAARIDPWYATKIDELFAESAFLPAIEAMYQEYVDKSDEDPMSDEWRCCTDAQYQRYLKDGILPFFDLDYIVMDHERGEVMFKLETKVDGNLAEHGFNVIEADGKWSYEYDGANLLYLQDEVPAASPKSNPQARASRRITRAPALKLRDVARLGSDAYSLSMENYDEFMAVAARHTVEYETMEGVTRKQLMNGEMNIATKSYADFFRARANRSDEFQLCGLEFCAWTEWLDEVRVPYIADERPDCDFHNFPVGATKLGIVDFYRRLNLGYWNFLDAASDLKRLGKELKSADFLSNECFWHWGIKGQPGDALAFCMSRARW